MELLLHEDHQHEDVDDDRFMLPLMPFVCVFVNVRWSGC